MALGGISPVSDARAVSVSTVLGTTEKCQTYAGLPDSSGPAGRFGMVAVPAGTFSPGSTHGYPDEKPAGAVKVGAFWMDRTEVTNAQFAAFVRATAFVTTAERLGGAAVFRAPAKGEAIAENSWWVYTRGADWRHPEGPPSNLQRRENQPVIHVSQSDALAYARWLGNDLPTEAEWEWAAHGGGDPERVEREPRDRNNKPTANYWQGVFPDLNTREDGFADRAPVGCFAANGYGLHDLIGNVWEWTKDPYRGPRQPHGNGDPAATLPASVKPGLPMVIKGGSFLCAADYCVRYRAAARQPQEFNLGAAHVGFRTVRRESQSR